MKLYALALATLLVSAIADEDPADVMARNILEWIQGIYRQGVRKTRQQSETSNAYLPPYNSQRPPEKPRPFQPATTQQPQNTNPSQNEVSDNYPDYGGAPAYSPQGNQGLTGQPNFTPTNGGSTGYNYPQSSFAAGSSSSSFGGSPTSTTYLPPPTRAPSSAGTGGYPYPSPGNRPTPGFPTPTRPAPGSQRPGPGSTPQRPGTAPGPQRPLPGPGSGPQRPAPGRPAPGPGTSPTPGSPPTAGQTPGQTPGSAPTGAPTPAPTPAPAPESTPEEPSPGPAPESESEPGPAPGSEPENEIPSSSPGATQEDDDEKHPPHIHSLDVQCSKTMMTINIEFNRVFNGVIYSKGFYMMPQCRYVQENSNQLKYSFVVNLDSCGTQFINDFEGAGQAYLENTLVLQNEPGIQEVWDTVRSVRCLWEGNINKALTVSLSVDMLNQEIVTFSGDTATAKLDIQVGKGPFAPAANGLVKIGDTMTLVVSVEGDPGFDLVVRDCIARDESSANMYMLTDERGCILKPKLFGAFQKTNDTGNSGASIIAYAYFQAFKFPDVMDLFIECNVELCKANCQPCPEADQQIEPGRRKRSVSYATSGNWSQEHRGEGVRVGHRFRVVMPDELPQSSSVVPFEDASSDYEDQQQKLINQQPLMRSDASISNVCLSYAGFYVASATMLISLLFSSLSAALLYAKLQRVRYEKTYDMPRCS